jgi:hypothetical protein
MVVKMDLAKVRKNSWKVAKKLGYPNDKSLPLIDLPLTVRPVEAVGKRMLALKAVLACAFSKDNMEMVQTWVDQENLEDNFTKSECLFVYEGKGDPERIELQIESLWMLAWCTDLIQDMDFSEYCGDYLSDLLPSIEYMNSKVSFMRSLELRPIEDITQALDLAYCLNWGAIEARTKGKEIPGRVREYVIEYRRKALEWVVSEEDWDKIIQS